MENKAKTVTEVLKAAKWMLENVGWCKNQYTKYDTNGKPMAFCAAGAISHVVTDCELRVKAHDRLSAAIKEPYIPNWNDDLDRTLPQVLKAFDKAIKAKR